MTCSPLERIVRIYGIPVLGAAAGGLVGGIVSALTGGPLAASLSVALGGLLYVAAGALGLPIRLAGLGLALGAHIAALTSYYSNPIPLPFLIVEVNQGRAALGIDIVQIILAHEVIALLGEQTPCQKREEGENEDLIKAEELGGDEEESVGGQEASTTGSTEDAHQYQHKA